MKNSVGCCAESSRRSFLGQGSIGLAGIALQAMLQRDSFASDAARPTRHEGDAQISPHFSPRAKQVIWLMMRGGVSHIESFDPKPELAKYAGKTLSVTPYRTILDTPYAKNVRQQAVNNNINKDTATLYAPQIGFRKGGQSGIEVSDWFPHMRECVDELAVIRSMWTSDNNHGAQLEMLTGRHLLDGCFPTLGAWVHYGLGAQGDNLPQFISMGPPLESQCFEGTDSDYLGPEHAGVTLQVDPDNPLAYARPARPITKRMAAAKRDLLDKLHQTSTIQYPNDTALRARIQSYEMAFRMQTSIPELLRFDSEHASIHQQYGLDNKVTRPLGQQLLAARRMVERGVRFVQVFHGDGPAGSWDAHSELRENHTELSAQVDRPIAGLIQDLKQRGLLDETIVVWSTEFGRTPFAQGTNGGRDHHNFGFSVWMAGGGIKKGIVHGATDELGFHAIQDRHYVTDLHATVLHLLGLDSRRLEIPGRKRLDIDHGHVIHDILA